MGRERRERREHRMKMLKIFLWTVAITMAVLGSGIAESQRIQVMEQTSAAATMAQMGVTQ